MVRLLMRPEQVIANINIGTLSMGHGRALLGLKNKEQLTALVNKIIDNHLNVRQVEQLINQLNNDGSVTKKEKKEPRSEERRVGKECRSRWVRYQCRKKQNIT